MTTVMKKVDAVIVGFGWTGAIMAKAARDGEEVLLHRFELEAIAALRASWGLFRDRRPETYGAVATLDGGL